MADYQKEEMLEMVKGLPPYEEQTERPIVYFGSGGGGVNGPKTAGVLDVDPPTAPTGLVLVQT